METEIAEQRHLPAVPDPSRTNPGPTSDTSLEPDLPTWERGHPSDPNRIVPAPEALANIRALRKRLGGDCRKVTQTGRLLPPPEPSGTPTPPTLNKRVHRLEQHQLHLNQRFNELEARLEDLEWR